MVSCLRSVTAQEAKLFAVSGIVKSKAGKTLPGADIKLYSQDSAVILSQLSDTSGKFIFRFTQKGNFFIHVQARGMKDFYSGVFTITATDDFTLVNIEMTEAEQRPEELTAVYRIRALASNDGKLSLLWRPGRTLTVRKTNKPEERESL